MSSLLRSPATRRALSAASSGGPLGASFLRAPSAAASAVGGKGGASVRRGLGIPTVPRRHLCGQPKNGEPTARSLDQFDELCEKVRATKVSSLEKDLLPLIVESSSKACAELVRDDVRRTWMVSAMTLGGFFAGCLVKARKMDKERELRNGTDENLPN